MFERHVRPAIYDKIFATAEHEQVQLGLAEHVMTAEEAAQMLHEGQRVVILTRTGAWRIVEHGITIRPLLRNSLVLTTSLLMRSDNNSRMLGQFTRLMQEAFAPTSQSNEAPLGQLTIERGFNS